MILPLIDYLNAPSSAMNWIVLSHSYLLELIVEMMGLLFDLRDHHSMGESRYVLVNLDGDCGLINWYMHMTEKIGYFGVLEQKFRPTNRLTGLWTKTI